MVKIEELLTPGETVIKKQGGIQLGHAMGPTGDLFLTNTRLIFLHKKRWAVISPASLMGKDTSIIKFEKSAYLPEGFFDLPSQAYRPRLLVRNGKVLGIDLLINYDVSAREGINIDLLQDAKEINLRRNV